MKQTKIKNWIFDWSGTLVDDIQITVDATNAVLEHYGKEPMSREHFLDQFRLPYNEFYEDVLPGVPLEELENIFRAGMRSSVAEVMVLPHVREALEAIHKSGGRMFVLTSMCYMAFPEQAKELRLEHYFTACYAGVLDKREMIGRILDEHGMCAEETVFIGDMTHDIDTANHAGIGSVAVCTGYMKASMLAQSEPDLILPDLRALRFLQSKQVVVAEEIGIAELEVPTFVGVPDEERAQQQVVKVSVKMKAIAGFASLGDELDGGVDYALVAERIKAVALEKPRKLIETLVDDISRMILAEFAVQKVEVVLEKFILPETRCVSVRQSVQA